MKSYAVPLFGLLLNDRLRKMSQVYLYLVTDVLEQRTNIVFLRLLFKQMVLDPAHWTILAVICEVIPRARITVQHSLRLDELPSIFAALALERVMRIAFRLGIVEEKLAQAVGREVTFDVFGAVDDATRERLLVRLTLKDLFLDRTGGNEAVYEAVLFLSITPDTGKRLLVSSRIPIRVEQDETVSADEVETTATGFRRK